MGSQNRGYGFELVMVLVRICWLLYTVLFTPFGFKIVCAYPILISNYFSNGQKGIEHNHSYVVMVTEDLCSVTMYQTYSIVIRYKFLIIVKKPEL